MKSIDGLKDIVIAALTSDDENGAVYETPEKVEGAIDMSVTPSNTDPDVQYADDVEWDVVNPDPNTTVTLEWAQLPLSIREKLGGHKMDDNGVLVETAGDTPGYFAIGGKAARRDGGYRYFWLLKCRAKPIADTFHTKEGETVTRQTAKVEFTAIKRTYDNQWRHMADEEQNGFTTEKAKAFLSSVYTPSFSAAG